MCLRRTSRSDDESATVPVAPKEGFAAAPTRTIPAPACSAQRTLKLFCYYYMQLYHLYCATLRTNGHGACASHDRRQPNYQQQQSTATWRPGNPTQCRSSSHVGAWSAIPTNTSAVRTAAGPKPPSHSWTEPPRRCGRRQASRGISRLRWTPGFPLPRKSGGIIERQLANPRPPNPDALRRASNAWVPPRYRLTALRRIP